MALLTVQQIGLTDAAPTYQAAAAGGDSVYPDDRGFLHVKNGGGSTITATLVIPGSLYGQARPDVAFSIAAASERLIGPLTADMADPTDGQIDLTYSGVTSVTVALRRI